MMRPVLIGLPGAGKSLLAGRVADRLGLPVFRSDEVFRECRAVLRADDPRRAIMEALLERTSSDPRHAALCADARADDGGGRCRLAEGGRFRDHGEDLFRLYEVEMLRWHDARGDLDGVVPDLSSSAPLLAEVRSLFSPGRGYRPILLDVSAEAVADNLLADYRGVLLARRSAPGATVRGGFERRFEAVRAGRSLDDPEVARAVRAEALAMTLDQGARRLPAFEAYAAARVEVRAGEDPDAVAGRIAAIVSSAPA